MKAYMGSGEDPSEGACLIFAPTAKEAKKILWHKFRGELIEDFTEGRIKWIRNEPWLFKLKKSETAHGFYPPSCDRCETWGISEIVDGYCEDCRTEGVNP